MEQKANQKSSCAWNRNKSKIILCMEQKTNQKPPCAWNRSKSKTTLCMDIVLCSTHNKLFEGLFLGGKQLFLRDSLTGQKSLHPNKTGTFR